MFISRFRIAEGSEVEITGSKSLSNRWLVLQKLFGSITIKNLSNARDTSVLCQALASKSDFIDIHHAGTAMRFLTAYFAIQDGKAVTLSGSERMKERPIRPLVEALVQMGASISYDEKEGYPPLTIMGKKMEYSEVDIPADISSQFISALLLISGKLKNGLKIRLRGKATSKPYLEMTLSILREIGIEVVVKNNTIEVLPFSKSLINKTILVESDWSSASYFYMLAAVGRNKLTLGKFQKNSLQGDAAVVDLFRQYFGVHTEFREDGKIILVPVQGFIYPKKIDLNMNSCPDIAQTICVTASLLRIPFCIKGLHTLKIKETDRLSALKNELRKMGVEVCISEDSIRSLVFNELPEKITVKTYNDHRMAMSFLGCGLMCDVEIEDAAVVEKSYPLFWKDIGRITRKI
ncbi:3-phosphoshikimate 1-carboxyvinyltransferase [Riemerella columbipharyngis]|uniref:3-phosphoshikimate 1-carboxyvinyltransferase n=1 Tax=Riemerella columbipharyngis TaxID=1071918 RepID=A0A1G7BP36_9FLAO|nr:3-phosphoshikimate 1-carboxyvinyltransferase [Riemerella columbipharyngis]SDE28727.1 3-phosphoshikimate 1-carboxyvinyltransferase [Riemerella columbipharyngis]